jgi:putative redox protein
MDVVETMAERGQKLDSLKVEVRGDRAADYPMPFTDLHLHYIAKGDIDPAIFRACLQESMNLYCAAALSMTAKKHVTYELNDIVYSLYE